jgi:hypothetical protein
MIEDESLFEKVKSFDEAGYIMSISTAGKTIADIYLFIYLFISIFLFYYLLINIIDCYKKYSKN